MRVGRPEPFVDQGFLIVKDDLWVLSLYGVFQQDIGPDNLTTYSRYPIEWGSGSTARSEHQPAHDHLDLTPVGTGQYVRAGALPGCRVVRCAAGLLAHGCVGDWTNPVSTNTPDVNFRISVVSREPIPIPTDRFSVRQNSAIWFDGYYYLYADVIPWGHPYHPDSYDTSIHLFRSTNAEDWEYRGEVIGKGKPGEWTANGIATPGACLFNGRIYVAYSVRGNRDGSGHRFIGVSVADDPAGPFRKLPELRIIPRNMDYSKNSPTLLLDDPCLVGCNADGSGPGNERLSIYYRRSLNDYSDSEDRGRALEYGIRCRYVADARGFWSDSHPVLAAREGKVVEAADARWINGRLVMIVLGYSEGEMTVYVSFDSRTFVPAVPHRLESYLDVFMPAACFRLPGLIQDPDGQVRHMTTPGDTDDKGHYTQWVYQIACR